MKIQGKKGKADTDPAATLRMHLDSSLGEKKEKREENEVNPLGPWRARKGQLERGKRDKSGRKRGKRKGENLE